MHEFNDDVEKFIPIGNGYYVVKALATRIQRGSVTTWHPILGDLDLKIQGFNMQFFEGLIKIRIKSLIPLVIDA